MKKSILLALLASLAVIAACVGSTYLTAIVRTAGHADGADRFLTLLAAGDLDGAYAAASADLRAEQDEDRFTTILTDIGPKGYTLESWPQRSLPSAGRAEISGTISAQDGRTIPVAVALAVDSGEWRVSALTDIGRLGVGPGVWFRRAPLEGDFLRLIGQTQSDIKRWGTTGELLDLNGTMFSALKTVSDPRFLHLVYRPFIQPGIDLDDLLTVDPVFDDSPQLLRWRFGDILVVSGLFPVEPQPIPLRYLYRYIHPNWKLFSVQIRETFDGLDFDGQPAFSPGATR